MFAIDIVGTPVIFSKFFASSDRLAVLAAIPEGTNRVVFIDTPATAELAPTIEALVARGIEIHVRDHHDAPARSNPREVAIADAADKIRGLLGGNAVISHREANPGCSSLIEVGQFSSEGTVIVADPDPDGLTAAMKAAGVFYPELDTDAAVLDGARSEQTAERLSPLAFLLTRGMSTLPGFDSARPQVSEDAKGKLFAEFVAAASGDAAALASLDRKVVEYEVGVKEALRLATLITEPVPGVAFVDCTQGGRFDLATLAQKMDARPGTKVTVQRKNSGPIAGKHGGIQISLAVPKPLQKEINLQELLPAGFESSLETGAISNTTFLLHVSQGVWDSTVLPALKAKFGG